MVPGITSYTVLGADLVISSASPVDTGLSVPIPANQFCEVSGYFPCFNGAGATGLGFQFTVTNPVAYSSLVARLYSFAGLATNAVNKGHRLNSFPANFAFSTLVAVRDDMLRFDFAIRGGPLASVMNFFFYRNTGVGSVTLYQGGYFSQTLVS